MKLSKTYQAMEYIAEIFAEYPEGLTTAEVHRLFQKKYYTITPKSIRNRLKDMASGKMEGVELQFSNRGKHRLTDRRLNDEASIEALKKSREKLLNEERLLQEERIYMRLAMESIRELKNLSEKHHRSIEKRLKISGIESPYFIDKEDSEIIDMNDPDVIFLKEAIFRDNIVGFKYSGKGSKDYYVVEPYKLIIFDGLWYLFGKDCDDRETPYKTWRLSFIRDVEADPNQKHQLDDETIEETLANAESADFTVTVVDNKPVIPKPIEVKLKFASHIAERFDYKAHIPGVTQKPTFDDEGNFYVTARVNTLKDIDAEIKSWLPHVEVLAPEAYRKSLKEELESYLETIYAF